MIAYYNADLVAKHGENCKGLYGKSKSFQGAYCKYKRHIFDLIPDSENKDKGAKMERASFLKEERQKNHEFLKAIQDSKIHRATLEVAPGYVLEAGHIYTEIAVKYITNAGFTRKKKAVELEGKEGKEGKEKEEEAGDGELNLYELFGLDDEAAGEAKKNMKKIHKSTYVLDVMHKKKFDTSEFWSAMITKWMGKWQNPIAKVDPLTPLYRIGLIANEEMLEYEQQYDCKFNSVCPYGTSVLLTMP